MTITRTAAQRLMHYGLTGMNDRAILRGRFHISADRCIDRIRPPEEEARRPDEGIWLCHRAHPSEALYREVQHEQDGQLLLLLDVATKGRLDLTAACCDHPSAGLRPVPLTLVEQG
ncbi:MAG: hypothetical protein D6682_04110 [Zetaproteobacteria bacterium]|nr:MAG: hypothetical protein D6682_04110 [Zetaproteobacteria bacterium]